MGKKVKKEAPIKLQHIQQIQNKQKDEKKQTNLIVKAQKQQKPNNKTNQKVKDNQGKITDKKKPIKHNRLIIRNLVFDINEKHVRKLVAPFGEIKEINIPNHPDKKIARGFAFVEMANKNDCLRAIKKLNGINFKGRTIVLDMAVSKQNFMSDKLNEAENKQKTKLENEKLEKKQQNMEDQNQQQNEDQNNNNELEKQEQDHAQQDLSQKNDENDEQQQSQQQDEQKQKKMLDQKQDHMYQIFIRNIPISTNEKDLFKHFVKYGKIEFVKVVKNKQTNLSKGTAFIKFTDPEVPQKLIEYSRSYEMYLLKKIKNFVPDPNINLQIDGAIVKIFPVQSRQQITDKLKQRSGQQKSTKKTKPAKKIKKLEDVVKLDVYGKRNLALALIGKWKAEENMNKYDYEMFKNHEKDKIQKLKNPNESISSTRVILKHIDKTITEQQLRAFSIDYLNSKNLNRNHLTYCKLMLEKDMKKSAGFAFIEFKKHETAKQFIQQLAKNHKLLQPKLFIVQFAIQDSRKMLKLKKRNQPNLQPKTNKKEQAGKKLQKHKGIKKQRHKNMRNGSKNNYQNKRSN